MGQVKKQRYYGLEWLRFLMALWMVTYHFSAVYEGMPKWFADFSSMAFFATSTFFMLSGYLLAHVALDRNHDMKMSGPLFVARRMCNLYPIHIITLLLAIVLLWLDPLTTNFFQVNYNTHPSLPNNAVDDLMYNRTLSWPEVAQHMFLKLTLLHAWDPRFIWLNGASWSISTLLFFYACFPWVAPRLMRIRRWVMVLLVVWLAYLSMPAVASWTGQFDHVTVGILHRNPLVRLPEFLAGILLCRGMQEEWLRRLVARYRYLLLAVGMSGVIVGKWLIEYDGLHFFYLAHDGLLLPFEGMVLLSATGFKAPKTDTMKAVLQRLGECSLSIFVLHTPLIKPTRWLTHEALDRWYPAWDVGVQKASEYIVPAWTMPIHLTLLVVMALLMQRYIVRPVRAWLESRLYAIPWFRDEAGNRGVTKQVGRQ